MKTFEFDENDIVVDTTCISDTPDDILYFDIETTGLSANRSDLYLSEWVSMMTITSRHYSCSMTMDVLNRKFSHDLPIIYPDTDILYHIMEIHLTFHISVQKCSNLT